MDLLGGELERRNTGTWATGRGAGDYFYRRSNVNKGTECPVNPFCWELRVLGNCSFSRRGGRNVRCSRRRVVIRTVKYADADLFNQLWPRALEKHDLVCFHCSGRSGDLMRDDYHLRCFFRRAVAITRWITVLFSFCIIAQS